MIAEIGDASNPRKCRIIAIAGSIALVGSERGKRL